MSILALIIGLVLLGVLMWAINAYIPMQPTIKKILNVAVVIAVILFLLYVFGIWGELKSIRVPRV